MKVEVIIKLKHLNQKGPTKSLISLSYFQAIIIDTQFSF